MKQQLLLSLIASTLLLPSCSTVQVTGELGVEQQRIALAFDSVDQKMRADAILEIGNDLRSFGKENYEQRLSKYKSERAKELRENLKDFSLQVQGYERTFVVCAFSKKYGMAICDDPQCAGIEKKEATQADAIIEQWRMALPLKDCPRH